MHPIEAILAVIFDKLHNSVPYNAEHAAIFVQVPMKTRRAFLEEGLRKFNTNELVLFILFSTFTDDFKLLLEKEVITQGEIMLNTRLNIQLSQFLINKCEDWVEENKEKPDATN